jgi:hypothetical protein
LNQLKTRAAAGFCSTDIHILLSYHFLNANKKGRDRLRNPILMCCYAPSWLRYSPGVVEVTFLKARLKEI